MYSVEIQSINKRLILVSQKQQFFFFFLNLHLWSCERILNVLSENLLWHADHICYCPKYFPRQKVVQSQAEWDYTELIECTGFLQRQPESHRRIKFGAGTCWRVLHYTGSTTAIALTLRSKLERLTVSSSFSLRFLFWNDTTKQRSDSHHIFTAMFCVEMWGIFILMTLLWTRWRIQRNVRQFNNSVWLFCLCDSQDWSPTGCQGWEM